MSTVDVYVSKEQPSIADDASIKNAFYDAPTVVTLFAPRKFLYAESDACVAAENMLLAATSLGIGSCYIGSAWDSFEDPFGHETLQRWGVRTDYYSVLHVLLGYPKDPMDEIIKAFNYYNLSYEDDGNNSKKLFAHFELEETFSCFK